MSENNISQSKTTDDNSKNESSFSATKNSIADASTMIMNTSSSSSSSSSSAAASTPLFNRKGSAIWSSPERFDDDGYHDIKEVYLIIKSSVKMKQQGQPPVRSPPITSPNINREILNNPMITHRMRLTEAPTLVLSELSSDSESPFSSSSPVRSPMVKRISISEPLISMKYIKSTENLSTDHGKTTIETTIKVTGKLTTSDNVEKHVIKDDHSSLLENEPKKMDHDSKHGQPNTLLSSFENVSKSKIRPVNSRISDEIINDLWNDDHDDDSNDMIKFEISNKSIKTMKSNEMNRRKSIGDKKSPPQTNQSSSIGRSSLNVDDRIPMKRSLTRVKRKSNLKLSKSSRVALLTQTKHRRLSKKISGPLFDRITKPNRQLRLYIHRMFHQIVAENEYNIASLQDARIMISKNSIELLNSLSREIIQKFAAYANQLILYSGRSRIDYQISYSTINLLLLPIIHRQRRTFADIIHEHGYYESNRQFKIIGHRR